MINLLQAQTSSSHIWLLYDNCCLAHENKLVVSGSLQLGIALMRQEGLAAWIVYHPEDTSKNYKSECLEWISQSFTYHSNDTD